MLIKEKKRYLEILESKMTSSLPEMYRDFLLNSEGLVYSSDNEKYDSCILFTLSPDNHNYDLNVKSEELRIDRWIAIGEDIGENYIFMNLDSSELWSEGQIFAKNITKLLAELS